MRFKRIIAIVLLLAALLPLLWQFAGTGRRTFQTTRPEGVDSSESQGKRTIGDPGRPPSSIYSVQLTNSQPGITNLTFATLSSNTPSSLLSAQTNQLNGSVLRQIAALQADKAQRTPTQQKIDSQLLFAEKMRRGVPIADGVPTLRVELSKDGAGRVEVDITAKVTDELLHSIVNSGGKVVNSFVQYNAVRAWMPLAEVESLAGREEVKFVRPAVKAYRNTGSVDSEGDFTHRAIFARTNFNVSGAGIKVGLLSDSVDYLTNAQATSDLGSVTVITNQIGVLQNGYDGAIREGEGTAMLEIVHDLAPGAQLYFATAQGSPAAMAQNILDLRFKYGCDIIVDDWEYYNESPFQDAIIAAAVNSVTANGALYFSSASNSGNKDDNTSSTWEGDFVDSGTTSLESGRVHSFGTASYNVVATGGYQRHVDLFWSDPLVAATNDYDVYILDSSGSNVVASSTNPQTGTQDPYEGIDKVDVGERIVIVKYSGTSRFLHLEVGRGILTTATAGRTKGHSATTSAFSVAAVPVSEAGYTNVFTGGAKNPVETFSSDGPRRVFYNSDGSPITPANFSSSGGSIRQKPDIAAADGVTTTLPSNSGLNPFFGTSAAAPHAAAIAALLKSYNPSLTPAQIRTALTSTALDIMSPGVDRDSGYGIVMADAALAFVAGPSVPTITAITPTTGAINSSVIITGTKFNGITGVQFNGVNAAFTVNSDTQITATVPVGAVTGFITVSTLSITVTSTTPFTVLSTPAIISFTPVSASPGSSVFISGANFSAATTVKFNGTTAAFTVNSSTQITATVPASATTGRITVKTPSGTATSSSNFTVALVPIVTGFSPSSGGVGSTVIVTGANFLGATNANFNGVSAAGTINSANQLTLTVPVGAVTGPIIVNGPGGQGVSTSNFTVIPAPSISSFSPASGPVGTVVTINGANFGNATSVKFSGVSASFTVVSTSQITVNVPMGATTGNIAVQTPGGTSTSVANFTVLTPPANDNFASAQTISGNSGTVSGNNQAATKQAGEPNHAGNVGGRSVWYRWVAPANGVWEFDTSGSGFDTLLAVYTGSNVTNLTVISSNDDFGGVVTSKVSFLASSGTVYWISVDGYNAGAGGAFSAASGNLTLNWSLTTSVPVISSFSPNTGTVGTTVTVNGANYASPLTIRFNGVAASGTFSPNSITVTVPSGATTGPITVTTPGGTATSSGNFTVLNPPSNDNFANAQVITGNSGAVSSNNLDATKETNEPNHAGNPGGKSVWYKWVAPATGIWRFDTLGSGFDTVLAAYTGVNLGSLVSVVADDDSGPLITSCVAFSAVGGQSYSIAVDGSYGASGSFILNWSFVGASPVISNFFPTSGGVGSRVFLSGANLSTASQVMIGNVACSNITIYSSTQISAQIGAGATSGPISVTTAQGSTSSDGTFAISNTPPNDEVLSAIQMPGRFGLLTGNNAYATKEAGEPNHAGNVGGRSLWYLWTAPTNGSWTIDTYGSTFDTLLGVYTIDSNGYHAVATNDDDIPFQTSSITFTATANTPYWIAVDGYNGASGDLTLRYFPVTLANPLYFSDFEPDEGYPLGTSSTGLNSWASVGNGQHGILVDGFYSGSGQQAYLGFAPQVTSSETRVYTPINYTPTASRPVVSFSVDMSIVDSASRLNYDHFRWRVYNTSGVRLLGIDFDNSDLHIRYALDNPGTLIDTGYTFYNSTLYTLTVTMDFARNLWSAAIGGVTIVSNQPLTTTGAGLNLGDIDAVWVPRDPNNSGDNYLLFDNYSITTAPSTLPVIVTNSPSLALVAGSSTALNVLASGIKPLIYQWYFNGNPIVSGTNAVLPLTSLSAGSSGNYVVVVSNPSGSVTSQSIPLTVLPALTITWPNPSSIVYGTLLNAAQLNASANVAGTFVYSPPANTLLNAGTNQTLSLTFTPTDSVNYSITSTTNHIDVSKATPALNWSAPVDIVAGTALGTNQLRATANVPGTFVYSPPLGTVLPDGIAQLLSASFTPADTNDYFNTNISVPLTVFNQPQALNQNRFSDGRFQINFVSDTGRTYTVQVSVNLKDWAFLTNCIGTGSNTVFLDSSATNLPLRFYRLSTP